MVTGHVSKTAPVPAPHHGEVQDAAFLVPDFWATMGRSYAMAMGRVRTPHCANVIQSGEALHVISGI